ncbi:unnamed protein product [Prorocentrum cordatum]|uniref:Phytanoyl-CoA dioxygenase n=1 Tax=Prorocentrum cordatum TaxID=2364126 RepID=A0ABN9XWD7_9DINO|nr:unnamed protein product [Polarella glacialis]
MHSRLHLCRLRRHCIRLPGTSAKLGCRAPVRGAAQAPLRPVPRGWLHASGAHAAKQRNHRLTAEEEQELVEGAPTSTLPGLSPECLAADPEAAAITLAEEGLLRLNGILGTGMAAALHEHVDDMLKQSIQSVADGSMPYSSLFGEFMCREHRYDLLLPLDAVVLRTVRHVIDRVSPLLEHAIGEDCTMCELEAIVNDPGSHAQPLHFDTDLASVRVAMLIALQDVTPSMGPTAFYPCTNTAEWHIIYKTRGQELEDLLGSFPRVVAEMSAGDAFVYDTRVLHYGGANTSHVPADSGNTQDPAGGKALAAVASTGVGTRRTMFGISFQVESGCFRTDNANMRREYRSKYRIAEACRWTPS